MLANQDTYNQTIITNSNLTAMDTAKQAVSDFKDKIAQGIDPGKAGVAAMQKAIPSSLQSYTAGSVTMPSAVTVGSSAQTGTNSPGQVSLTLNFNNVGDYTKDQLTSITAELVTNSFKKLGINANMSSVNSKVGG
jgi:hypothetical protein